MPTPTPPNPLTTESGLATYLTTHSIPYTRITLLTGGTANYVYRITLPSPSPPNPNATRTLIYKHAAPYLHSQPTFAFDTTRMDYENRVLEILPPLLEARVPGTETKVRAVGWRGYDRAAKLLCIEDGGDRHLKGAYGDLRVDVEMVGRELGRWIAALHLGSVSTSLSLASTDDGSKDPDLEANNPIGVGVYRHSYRNLHLALEEYGYDAKFGQQIDEEFGSRLTTDNECVCHGDFWPGNVLVKFSGDEQKDVQLTVVDWEMTRRGISATDVGQFAAEAFLLDRFRGDRGLLPVFLDAYVEVRKQGDEKIGKEWVRRMAVHWGVHVAFWPTRVEWANREGTQKLVDIGVSVLKAAVDGDWEKLRASELLKDVGETWTKVWDDE